MSYLGFLIVTSFLWVSVIWDTVYNAGIAWNVHVGSIFWESHTPKLPQHAFWLVVF